MPLLLSATRSLSLFAALLLAATTAQAEVLDRSTRGFTLRNVVDVPVTPAQAWKGLVDDVGQWWPSEHTWFGDAAALSIEARAGGCFCERSADREAAHMQVAYVEPGKLLRMLGALGPLQGMGLNGALDWKFEAIEGGTRITMWNQVGGYTPDDLGAFAAVVDKVQAQQLGGLADHLGAH